METKNLSLKKFISLALCVSTLSGCGTAETEPEIASDTTTLDWYINFSWFNTRWGSNVVSRAITEKTGVDINFITPQGNEDEKLNSLIESGNLPDMITLGWWEPQVNEMIQKDMVYAINKLADEYDPYFYDVSDPQAVSWYTQSDGNIYGYPSSSITHRM